MKTLLVPTILWQGDRIRCMKSPRTLQCKMCMVERKEILSRFRNNKSKIMNNNSDIFSSCKCNSRFHKFSRTVTKTLRKHLMQKKVNSKRHSKHKRKRFSTNLNSQEICMPVTPEPESPKIDSAPPVLYDINIPLPGFPHRSPTARPTNLELAQVRYYLDSIPPLEV